MYEPDLESTKKYPWISQSQNMISAGMDENAAVDDNGARQPSENPRIQSLTAQINHLIQPQTYSAHLSSNIRIYKAKLWRNITHGSKRILKSDRKK